MKDLLLITPPFTQLNTPYPATAYLKGFLNTKGIGSFQMDLGLEVLLNLFSKEGLEVMFNHALSHQSIQTENSKHIYALRKDYVQTIDEVVLFLQGKNQSLARQICGESFLPQASRFDQISDLDWSFGNMGFQDKAKHLATLYLEDLSDFIRESVDEHFGVSRYAEKLGKSANSFDELQSELQKPQTPIDEIGLKILDEKVKKLEPKIIGFSVPFPGNLYAAFRCAAFLKTIYPDLPLVLGGGFPTTELRSLTDPRVFDYFDYICLDDGALPLETLIHHLLNPDKTAQSCLKRTFLKENGKILYNDSLTSNDYSPEELGCPDYSDLHLDKYLSVIEITNPMHSLWSDGRWNKLTMAHGCYWGKCTFCDGSLDYIKRYEPTSAKTLVDRMEQLAAQTGESGFHFVDEAAPPALMGEVALEILRRGMKFTWWTNIRFEKSFTRDLCLLLKAAGCIGVSGGLEVASDRLLHVINKGVSVSQVSRVTSHFTEAGILVHTYLMYSYPSQTIQETVDSLEMVRQMFDLGIIQSGFWHRFALTAHSPIGAEPESYGIFPKHHAISFANNDLEFTDKTKIQHEKFSYGLEKSLLNFMHGIGFDLSLQSWFDFKIPAPTVPLNYIQKSLNEELEPLAKTSSKIVWLGSVPESEIITKTKRGQTSVWMQLNFHTKKESFNLLMEPEPANWFLSLLKKGDLCFNYGQCKADYETQLDDFESFWYSKPVQTLRKKGLLLQL